MSELALPLSLLVLGLASGVHCAGMCGGIVAAFSTQPVSFARTPSRLGVPLWRRIQPLAARLLPARTLQHAYAAGALWGWLPCGLVYSALAASAFAGGPASGAAAMLAFGIGTLPNLLAAGLAATQVRKWLRGRAARAAAGAAVLLFGAYGLAHAGGIAEAIRGSLLCL